MMRFGLVALVLALGCSGNAETSDDPGNEVTAKLDECASEGETSECQIDGQPGARVCQEADLGFEWSACAPTQECQPGDSLQCAPPAGSAQCELYEGSWQYPPWACATPLVLSFDDAPVEFTQAPGAFDLFGAGISIGTDWVGASTPWLVLDVDRDGQIADGSELFGSMTVLSSGQRASGGFEALAALDADHDGFITVRDPAFATLQLWSDTDQNRRSSKAELRSLSSLQVEAIGLANTVVPRCSISGCELERGRFIFRDASGGVREGAVIDVHLRGF